MEDGSGTKGGARRGDERVERDGGEKREERKEWENMWAERGRLKRIDQEGKRKDHENKNKKQRKPKSRITKENKRVEEGVKRKKEEGGAKRDKKRRRDKTKQNTAPITHKSRKGEQKENEESSSSAPPINAGHSKPAGDARSSKMVVSGGRWFTRETP